MARTVRRAWSFVVLSLALNASCTPPDKPPAPTPAAPAAPVAPPAPVPPPAQALPAPEPPALEVAAANPVGTDEVPVATTKPDVYSGKHKLGVNRVTDMARVGIARFSQKDGALHLEGRVDRGAHWLELKGRVEPEGPRKFVLVGTIRGVPDMTWAGEAPRERNTEGRFLFEMRHGRPYWRMYERNGRECVCNDDCGNDFCYIDIEQQPIAEAQEIAK